MAPAPNNLATFLMEAFRTRPQDSGLMLRRHSVWKTRTYRWWEERAMEWAMGLRRLGVAEGDRVVLLADTCLDWPLAGAGVFLAGAVLVPMSPSFTPEDYSFALERIQPKVIIYQDPEVYGRYGRVDAKVKCEKVVLVRECVVANPPPGKRPFMRLEDVVLSRDEVMIPEQLKNRVGKEDRRTLEDLGDTVRPSDTAVILFTPGTSGEPKGVMLTHSGLLYNARTLAYLLPLQQDDVQLLFLPLSHVLGMISMLSGVASGTPVALGNGVRALLEDLRDVKPTYMVGVPRIYEKIAEKIRIMSQDFNFLSRNLFEGGVRSFRQLEEAQSQGQRADFSDRVALDLARRTIFPRYKELFGGRMRFVVSGGAPLDLDVGWLISALGISVLEGFGLTETSGATHLNRQGSTRLGTVGPALPMVETRIGEDSEILVRTPGIMKGYFEDEEGTREVLDESGWFHTGDVGVLEGDGTLRITGRKKNLIVTATGKNIVPTRIESALTRNALISHAVVHGDRRSYIVALLTLGKDALMRWSDEHGRADVKLEDLRKDPSVYHDVEKLVEEANATLAPHERVRRFAVLDAEFTLESGELTQDLKVRRGLILERYHDLIEMLYEDQF